MDFQQNSTHPHSCSQKDKQANLVLMAGSSQDLGPSDPANIHQSVSTASERNRVSIDSIHSYSQDDADDLILDDHEPILANTSPARPFRGNTRIKGPNTICRIVFLTLCLAG